MNNKARHKVVIRTDFSPANTIAVGRALRHELNHSLDRVLKGEGEEREGLDLGAEKLQIVGKIC